MKVQNMISRTSGRPVANQFIISDNATERVTFQSYSSMIATIDYPNKRIEIGSDWDYSATTTKYRNQFFRREGFTDLASTKELTKAIYDGKFEDFTVEMV